MIKNLHNVRILVNTTHVRIEPLDPHQLDNNGSAPNVTDYYAECILNFRRRFNETLSRFSDDTLARTCARFKLWMAHNEVSGGAVTTAVQNLTADQQQFLRRLRECLTNEECFNNARWKSSRIILR